MGIFTRFMDIVNSNINSLLDKAEDPEKMLKLMISEMEDTIVDLKTSTASRMAEAIKLDKRTQEAADTVLRWQKRAELAIEKGRDDLAREALQEKKSRSEEYEKLKESLKALNISIEEGRKEIATLEEKVKSSKVKLENLIRENRREQEREKESVNLNARFEDLENRINRMNAYTELNRKKEEEDTESRFNRMERDDEVEEELKRIKKEKGIE